jgi:lipoate---protein ligase
MPSNALGSGINRVGVNYSMQAIRLLNLGSSSWLHTQAIYHALGYLMTEDSPDTIVLMRPEEPYLCVGYHQPLNAILDRDTCKRLNLPIVRRRVGGGTTYLDKNQQFYQCIFHHKRLPYRVDQIYQLLLGAPIQVLKNLGLNADLRGGNEIEVDHLRIAGIGGGRIGDAMIVVGNILLDFDYEIMSKVWHTPSDIFRHFAYDAMKQHITTLWSKLEQNLFPDEIQNLLASEYGKILKRPIELGTLTEQEWQKVEEIEAKLISEKWLTKYLDEKNEAMHRLKVSLGVFIHAEEAKLNGNTIYGTFHVHESIIQRAALHSLQNSDSWAYLEKKLINTPLKNWREALG